MQRSTADVSLSDSTVARSRAAIMTIAPLVMLAAFVYHPQIILLPNAHAVAHAVQADTVRWAIAHWGVGIGAALMGVAFLAIGGYLRDAGENRWSTIAVPFLVLSASVYAILPGMEFTVLAAARTGGDIVGSQEVIDAWFVPTLFISGVANATGVFYLTRAVRRAAVLSDSTRTIVVAALVIFAIARLVPIGPVHFYVQGLAGIAALWPIASDIRARIAEGRPARAALAG